MYQIRLDVCKWNLKEMTATLLHRAWVRVIGISNGWGALNSC